MNRYTKQQTHVSIVQAQIRLSDPASKEQPTQDGPRAPEASQSLRTNKFNIPSMFLESSIDAQPGKATEPDTKIFKLTEELPEIPPKAVHKGANADIYPQKTKKSKTTGSTKVAYVTTGRNPDRKYIQCKVEGKLKHVITITVNESPKFANIIDELAAKIDKGEVDPWKKVHMRNARNEQ